LFEISERGNQPLAEDLRMALLELLRKAELEEDVDFLREGVRAMAQQLMELEVAQHVGAEKYQRAANRTGEHNGHRDRNWDTRVGSI
jgi:putative transposase